MERTRSKSKPSSSASKSKLKQTIKEAMSKKIVPKEVSSPKSRTVRSSSTRSLHSYNSGSQASSFSAMKRNSSQRAFSGTQQFSSRSSEKNFYPFVTSFEWWE